MAEQGVKNVNADLQERTDPQPTDKLLMVNAATGEVQDLTLEKLGDTLSPLPTSSDNTFDMI